MGLKKWAIKKLIGKKTIKVSTADAYLKSSSDKFTRTLRDAEKINKANEFRSRERSLREELREGLDDEEDEEEEEEEDGAPEKMLMDLVAKAFASSTGNTGATPDNMADIIKNLTPEQIEVAKSLLPK